MRMRIALVLVITGLAACSLTPVEYGPEFFPPETALDNLPFRWMGAEGTVSLTNSSREMNLTLEGTVPLQRLSAPPTVRVVLNGTLLRESTIVEEKFRWTLPVSSEQQGDRRLSELRITTSQTFSPRDLDPESPDRRRLGLVIHKLSWERR